MLACASAFIPMIFMGLLNVYWTLVSLLLFFFNMFYACIPIITCLYCYVISSIYWCDQDCSLKLSGLGLSA